tara:strand:- start:36 stop:344 length:309 start_codon:yes stop_codon:yes gene_type:complete
MKIFRPISSGDLDKRIHKEFKKDTDYDIFHKKDGRIVVHFWDEEYLKNNPDKDGRNPAVDKLKQILEICKTNAKSWDPDQHDGAAEFKSICDLIEEKGWYKK